MTAARASFTSLARKPAIRPSFDPVFAFAALYI